MQSNLKVLHVLESSLPDVGGYTIRAKYIVDNLAKNNIKSIGVTLANYRREKTDIINGVSYYRSYRTPGVIEKLIYRIPFLKEIYVISLLKKKIEQILDEESVDVIHAHSPSLCGLPAMAVAKKRNIPFLYEVRALWEDAAVDLKRFGERSIKYKVSRALEQKLFDGADGIICICEGLRQEIKKRTHRENIYVIKNGVDTSIFKPLKKPSNLVKKFDVKNKVVVGFIGQFFTFEGIADLVRAVPIVISKNPNVKFFIIGGGAEEANLHALAKELGIMDNSLIFTGRVPHEEVNDYYAMIDILVYPRTRLRITEMVTPLKPLEAMAMEKSVIVSDVGGLKELVKDGYSALLFKADNVEDLAAKILHLVENDKLRQELGKNGREQMLREREWKIIAQGYGPIYKHVTKKELNHI